MPISHHVSWFLQSDKLISSISQLKAHCGAFGEANVCELTYSVKPFFAWICI